MMLAVVLAAALVGGRALAQLTPAQKQEMKQHYEKATRAYDVQKYAEAIEEYQKAYEIGGDPAMLFNIGQAYRLSDQLPEAVRFYRRYLQRSPSARNRDDVERKIAELDRTIEERRKAAAATKPPPLETPASSGSTKPPASTTPAATTPVASSSPSSTAPPAVPPPFEPAPPDSGGPRGAPGGMRIAGYALLATGGVGLVTAAITGKMASGKADDLTEASMRNATFDPGLEKSGKRLNTIAIVSLVLGGAAAAAGGVLLVLSHNGATAEHHALVSPLVGGGTLGAAATLRF